MHRFFKIICSLLIIFSICGCEKGKPIDNPDPVDPQPVEEPLNRVTSALTNYDVMGAYFNPNEVNEVLVVLVEFADGYQVNHRKFEEMFNGRYNETNYIKSISSYYRFNSYGRELLNFNFFYYQSELTSDEADDLVNGKGRNGQPLGNKFFYEIYEELKKEHKEEFDALDTNRDGYIGCAFFVFNDNCSNGYRIYGGAKGSTDPYLYKPVVGDPYFRDYVKTEYADLMTPLEPGSSSAYTKVIIHETGHLFGINDYYDFHPYEGKNLDTLGTFDMHSYNLGDENVYSKFACGWLNPYIVTEDIDSVTVTIKNSSVYNDAILIPTSAGWNGTAFDEYILIDVCAKAGANGYDWDYVINAEGQYYNTDIKNRNGGVRIYHVDSRLVCWADNWYAAVDDVYEFAKTGQKALTRYGCTNGWDPSLEGDNRFYHLLDIIPSDGSSKYRISTPTDRLHYTWFRPTDLFGPGDSFSMQKCADAFPNAPYMNNGSTLDYEITVESYNISTTEAVITIRKVNN